MHPHRFDEVSRQWLLDGRIFDILAILLDDEPLAAQSMFYFKPPGARGQQFHQDNHYLQARPAICLAAWTALDETDEENGGLFVYPGTHTWKVLCPDDDDGHLLTHLPEGTPVPARMKAGDVLFFNGALVHGSQRNSLRSLAPPFICHYISRGHCELSDFYHGAGPRRQPRLKAEDRTGVLRRRTERRPEPGRGPGRVPPGASARQPVGSSSR
jgi:hypothetical protein